MKTNKSKRAISLIVLVITIIVMIILATAIILSLNSSNISGKAGEAKINSDLANKKEAASVFLSEYEIKKAKGKIDSSTTADEYVKSEAKKAGLDITDIAVTDDGVILVGVAAMFKNQNIPIGTKVEGYKLNNTTSYTTSGKENTCSNATSETNPQPDAIERQDEDKIIWKYMGIDENGEALIVANATETSPVMTLGGKGGYLYGPQELNNACQAFYESDMGTARSINIDDVTRLIGYTGEKGAYYYLDTAVYRVTSKTQTVNEIAKEIGFNMSNFSSERIEDGKDVGTYILTYYKISRINDVNKYNSAETNENAINLIYPGTANGEVTYWLSSPSVGAYFAGEYVTFCVRYVSRDEVGNIDLFMSRDSSYYCEYAIRPVVSLNATVQIVSYNETDKVVTIK